jgi:hypothetical protein
MGRKRSERKTVMVRVYDDFAEKVRRAAGVHGLPIAKFCDRVLMPCIDAAHRNYIEAESRRLKIAAGGPRGPLALTPTWREDP